MYLKDIKEPLWHQFLESHPDGMKQTAFMSQLENSRFVYRDDLGELCLTYNEYGFGVFKDMVAFVKEKMEKKEFQVNMSMFFT